MKNDLINELLEISEKISCREIIKYQHNEFYTAGAFDSLLLNIKSYEAYELLELLCKKYIEYKSSHSNLDGYFSLLKDLVHTSNTTERPDGILTIIRENQDVLRDLRDWYRIK